MNGERRKSPAGARCPPSFQLPRPNLILGSVGPCDLWTVTAQANRKGN
jgi:hypothetical protein